jgi:hypothetical protein
LWQVVQQWGVLWRARGGDQERELARYERWGQLVGSFFVGRALKAIADSCMHEGSERIQMKQSTRRAATMARQFADYEHLRRSSAAIRLAAICASYAAV